MSEDNLIPTLAMARDPRLRRLFALAGKMIYAGEVDDELTWSLLDLAPEYLPPDEFTLDPDWAQLCADAGVEVSS